MAPTILCTALLCVLVNECACLHISAPHVPWSSRPARSMRGRHVRAVGDSSSDDDDGGALSGLSKLFKTNRNTPEAQANQIEWARQQMALEVPETTLEGDAIGDRADFVRRYIDSEREKFGREVDQATAEKEVDEWLLKQATFAPANVNTSDIAAAAAVFVLSVAFGLFVAHK